jgi:hypothetical protein
MSSQVPGARFTPQAPKIQKKLAEITVDKSVPLGIEIVVLHDAAVCCIWG